MKTTLLGILLVCSLALSSFGQFGSGQGSFGTIGPGGGGSTNAFPQVPPVGATNGLYVSKYGNDATAVFGNPAFPAFTLQSAINNVQTNFPSGGYIALNGTEIYTNLPYSLANGSVTLITNPLTIYGNGAQIWSISNSHAFSITPKNGNVTINDVLFCTTNNAIDGVSGGINNQGYHIGFSPWTNRVVTLNRCTFLGTIDCFFMSGAHRGAPFTLNFVNCINISGWNNFVMADTVADGTNIVINVINGLQRSDPNWVNTILPGSQVNLNPLSVSQMWELQSGCTINFYGVTSQNFNEGTGPGVPQGIIGASSVSAGLTPGIINVYGGTMDSSSVTIPQQGTNMTLASGWAANFYEVGFTNFQSITTNSATVNIYSGDYSGGNLYANSATLTTPASITTIGTPSSGLDLWVSNNTSLYVTWTNGITYPLLLMPAPGSPFVPIQTNFISGWVYSNTLNAPIDVTATVTNLTTSAALMELRVSAGFGTGVGLYTNMVTLPNGATNATMYGAVPVNSFYTFTNSMGTAGIRFGQVQPMQ